MRVNVTREGELRPGLVIVRKEYSPYGITKLAAAEPSILIKNALFVGQEAYAYCKRSDSTPWK